MMTSIKIYLSLVLITSMIGCGHQPDREEDHEQFSELNARRINKNRRQNARSLFTSNIGGSENSSLKAGVTLKHPVVFHHGFMGGTGMGMNMPAKSALEKLGAKVFLTEVSPAHSIKYRAGQLAAQIDSILAKSGSSKVNIIAHSMGGLDARYLISTMGYAGKIGSLTTIATPHRGTPLADRALQMGGQNKFLNVFVTLCSKGINSGSNLKNNNLNAALKDLTESQMEVFNRQNQDREGVYYQSYAGVSGRGSKDRLTLFLFISHRMIAKTHGKNDGVVPASSARWTNFKGEIPADHIDTSGFRNLSQTAINYENFILTIARDLSSRGL